MDLVLLGIPLGIVMLYLGSDWLVKGAKNLALRLGVAPFVIGLTIIAFGTSAPELITSVMSTSNPDLILGNVIGSNIVNIGIAIAVAALICPMAAKYTTMRIEITTMVLLSVLLLGLSFTGTIGLPFGVLLFAILFVFLYLVYRTKRNDTEGQAQYTSEVSGSDMGYPKMAVLIVAGLVLLYFGADVFVDGAVELAHMAGISDLLVGLIVVAIGTSLPEICVSVLSARRGENDLAVSNIVGSNIFNATAVLGAGALLADIHVSDEVVYFHLPVMIFISLCMYVSVRRDNMINRRSATVFLGTYIVYLALMIAFPSLAA